jgi:hypothetical protein
LFYFVFYFVFVLFVFLFASFFCFEENGNENRNKIKPEQKQKEKQKQSMLRLATICILRNGRAILSSTKTFRRLRRAIVSSTKPFSLAQALGGHRNLHQNPMSQGHRNCGENMLRRNNLKTKPRHLHTRLQAGTCADIWRKSGQIET